MLRDPPYEGILIPIALREDFLARVHIPEGLTKAEAERIARVVLAYAESPSPILEQETEG